MGNGRSQVDMTHTVATYLAERYFHTAFFAGNTLVLHALILAAQALIVLYRTEDARAEKTVALRLKCTVVNGFRLLHFTERPAFHAVWRSDSDLQFIK